MELLYNYDTEMRRGSNNLRYEKTERNKIENKWLRTERDKEKTIEELAMKKPNDGNEIRRMYE